MNKYRDKSDFEINKAVAIALGKVIGIILDSNIIYLIGGDELIEFDPCNNPEDAMPIVFKSRIAVCPIFSSDWCATSDCDAYRVINKNPYRAAMEVFLMMKEAE